MPPLGGRKGCPHSPRLPMRTLVTGLSNGCKNHSFGRTGGICVTKVEKAAEEKSVWLSYAAWCCVGFFFKICSLMSPSFMIFKL